jgi:formyltetrahydrofolate deformylase
MESVARLLITCPDGPGIVATVTNFLYNQGANITALDQYSTDPFGGTFFLRLEFQTPHLRLTRAALEESFDTVVARRFQMDWHMSYASEPQRAAILVSKPDHALLELLWRWRRGELPGEISMVISNHMDHAQIVSEFGLPYHHVPVTADTKADSEAQVRELVDGHADLLVLARYMQVLSPEFVEAFPHRIINIHHSFLPAFVGASPYRQAYDKGVKIIGATAHYVTADLDQGPIIDQDVVRVSHRNTVAELMALGRDIERQVLSRAVGWHLEDRIIVNGHKTVVFS